MKLEEIIENNLNKLEDEIIDKLEFSHEGNNEIERLFTIHKNTFSLKGKIKTYISTAEN